MLSKLQFSGFVALVAAGFLSVPQARGQAPVNTQAAAAHLKGRGYSPYAGRAFPTRVFWGDQHLHTAWSVDAGFGGTTLDPEDAVRFARGEEVLSNSGQPVKLARPLDWIAVTDHSDMMGMIGLVVSGDPRVTSDPKVRKWHEWISEGGQQAANAMGELIQAQSSGTMPEVLLSKDNARSIWERNTEIMEQYNEPGRFSAFIAYEFTPNPDRGDNLHRNVIYRNGKALADQVLPFTTFDSPNPEKLWEWMEAWEQRTGGSMLAIPHNGNMSGGRMFALTTFEGDPPTRAWAESRARWEPLYEVTQVKGTSEQHPVLAPTDEFAGFEIWDMGNLNLIPKGEGRDRLQYEYAREAFKNGLKLERELGVNPFKFGLVGGTDMHTGLSTAEENNFFSKFLSEEPRPDRWNSDALKFDDRIVKGWQLGATGWTGVWATENTREAIWDAMKRREVYATTGTRMVVRFFGGWDFTEADAATRLPAEVGYAKGVPMGGDLHSAPSGKAPTFLVAALRDPLSGNLDRIQVVKGWLDGNGETHERVHDVVWGDADRRRPGRDGKLLPVGNTVDMTNATWTNTIGDPELIAVWEDPDFDPSLRAFYYARVIEIPTPRWTAYDAVRYGVTIAPEVSLTTTERAWSSPIWYTP
jgi:hypothetical protein